MSAPDSDDHFSPFEHDAGPGPSAPGSTDRVSPEPDRPPAEPSRSQSSTAERDEPTAHADPPVAAEPDGAGSAEPDGPAAAETNGFRPTEGARPGAAESSRRVAAEASAPRSGAKQAGEGSEVAGDSVADGTAPDGESDDAGIAIAAGGPGLGAADAWPPDGALEAIELDDTGWTRRNLEAILLVADEPVPAATLAELVGARLTQVEALLIDLAGEYAGQGRGFVLRAVAGGWRLYTHPATRDVVEAYLRAGQQSRLTRAALETLAVIAYRQPVTRHQVAAVRGVNVDGVFRTLATRGLIHEVGHEEGPGQAALYGTTPAFLEQLGLNSLDQLPPIKDYLPEGVDLMDLLEQM